MIIVEVATIYKKWGLHKTINKTFIKKVSQNILGRFDHLNLLKYWHLSVLFTDDDYMLRLNNKYRGKTKATNVLAFPDLRVDANNIQEFSAVLNNDQSLGDLAFGYQTISQEAIEQNKTFEAHFTHLLVHGLLHLIGFDHQTDEEAAKMENLEILILNDFRISSPY